MREEIKRKRERADEWKKRRGDGRKSGRGIGGEWGIRETQSNEKGVEQ